MVGTGKSTIVHTVSRPYFDQGRLAASFFFSRGGGDVGNARKVVATIAVQLAVHIHDVLTEPSIITSQSLADQWRQLVLGPLLKLDGRDTYPSYVVVLDILDECEGKNDTQIIQRLLEECPAAGAYHKQTRGSNPVCGGRFCQLPDAWHRDFILHDIETAIVDYKISIFLDHELIPIGRAQNFGASWPGE